MSLQHDAFERRASARAAVRNQLKRIGHSLEFRPEECVSLVSNRIHRWIKKVFYNFTISKADRKFQHEFNVEMYGTDNDRELMAQCNARREESELAEFDRNVSRLQCLGSHRHRLRRRRSRSQRLGSCCRRRLLGRGTHLRRKKSLQHRS